MYFCKFVTGNFAKFKMWREIRGMFHGLVIHKSGVGVALFLELRMIGAFINYVDKQEGGRRLFKCQRYYISSFSKIVKVEDWRPVEGRVKKILST